MVWRTLVFIGRCVFCSFWIVSFLGRCAIGAGGVRSVIVWFLGLWRVSGMASFGVRFAGSAFGFAGAAWLVVGPARFAVPRG